MRWYRSGVFAWLVAIGFVAPAGAAPASFTPLGFAPVADPANSVFGSTGYAVSADGTVVVGTTQVDVPGFPGQTREQAFRWTATSGLVDLGVPSVPLEVSAFSRPFALSADGSTIVGSALFPVGEGGIGSAPFRWRADSGITELFPRGTNGFVEGGAFGISADGTVVTGSSETPLGAAFGETWRYTDATGPVGLGFFSDAPFRISSDGAVSADGNVVAGGVSTAAGSEAFRWTAGDGIIPLGDLAGGPVLSGASAVSADGTTIVGVGRTATGAEGFVWTAASGMRGIGTLPGKTGSLAYGVSGDGTVIVGQAEPFGSSAAFIWTAATGAQSLLDVLVAQGATGLDGWTLSEARGISPDGQWVVGTGNGPDGASQAFLARLNPVPLPAGFWLLGTALAAAFGRRQFRRT